LEPIVSVHRHFRRIFASSARPVGWRPLAALAVMGVATAAGAALAYAQGMSEQQMRCMQLQQELAAVRGGGGPGREEVGRIDQQIAQADRVFQGTQAAMDDAGCFERLFIFGRALVRSPKCLNMNNRVEEARRQLAQLQQQRQAVSGGGGNKRRQAELTQALARGGCAPGPQERRGGGLLDFFGGPEREAEPEFQTPVYRSIDPASRYRSVCVRLCDGFYFPISYATNGTRLGQDAERCQSTCAAPAELYVYRNPGQEIEHAISLQGSAYMDLPVALKYRKEFVNGCSCKQVEYNPGAIEAANKRAEADTTAATPTGKPAAKTPAPLAPAPAAVPSDQPVPQLDLDVTGSTIPVLPPPPAPAPAEASVVPAPPAPPPPAPQEQPAAGQSSIAKSRTLPAPATP
jgi:hypothetical protein